MTAQTFLDGRVTLRPGDCRAVLTDLEPESIDSCVTDPPYHLTSIVKRFGGANAALAKHGADGAFARASRGFMDQQWDGGDVAFQPETWAAVVRVLKPGAHLVAFSGTRTYHRMVCAIEDAGFEVRDQLAWVYGSGFPKSYDVAKGIDRLAGAKRKVIGQRRTRKGDSGGQKYAALGEFNQSRFVDVIAPATPDAAAWHGWGTALKPAWEPIVLARKPLAESSVARQVLATGTGAINVDGCRVKHAGASDLAASMAKNPGRSDKVTSGVYGADRPQQRVNVDGRFPANVVHDGSDEIVAAFPDSKSTGGSASLGAFRNGDAYGKGRDERERRDPGLGDSGSAARFFYCAKADADDRLKSKHPTVKPIDLMQWLVRLVTPKGGVCLDPFAGTGTTGEAAFREGMRAVLIEREAAYQADIARRMELAGNPTKRAAAAEDGLKRAEGTPLFGADQFDFGERKA